MGEKKRTTVTTIETHEVWVIKPATKRPDEVTVARLEEDHSGDAVPPTRKATDTETDGNETVTPGQ